MTITLNRLVKHRSFPAVRAVTMLTPTGINAWVLVHRGDRVNWLTVGLAAAGGVMVIASLIFFYLADKRH